uniref:Uncharacterized protein n=1 Tax=Fagus sylvatica TaxID=28930 RepID=A0A2N9HG05_FAGSY
MAPSRHHHPDPLDPLLLSIPPLNQPIWSCMGEFCWRLWVARASNRLSLFCWHDLAVPVGIEIFFDGGCSVGIGFRDLFQFEFLSNYPTFGVDYSKLFFFEEPLPHPKSFVKFDLTSQWFAWLGSRI